MLQNFIPYLTIRRRSYLLSKLYQQKIMSTPKPASKRRRVEVPISVKRQICQYKSDHPKATIQDIKSYVQKDFTLELGKSTIGDILRLKDKWVSESPDVLRSRNPKHQKLDDALFMWFTDMSSHHAAVNDEMMIAKAKVFGEKLEISDFGYSRGWLQRFKTRRGIKRRLYEGEADSADMTAVHNGRQALQKLLENYDPDDIYNIDETGLFFRLGPNATLATQKVHGTKTSKERLTVALTANASGTDKRRPFVIAKVNRPRCFGKTYDPETYVRYRSNKKAWMTADLFVGWLKDFDRQMNLASRNVILLCDNAASHTQGDLKLRSVKLHYLPPNTTSHIQPMDAGIIKTFKTYYRKQLVQHYIECAESSEKQTVNLRQALAMIKTAWDSVSSTTIANCYRHVNILQRPSSPEDPEEDMPLLELRRLLRQLPSEEDISAEAYVAIDDAEETGQQLQDSDIMSLVSTENSGATDSTTQEEEEEEDDECDKPQEDVTAKQAKDGIAMAIAYFEQTAPHLTTNDIAANKSSLVELWSMVKILRERSNRECRQSKMTDFFSASHRS